MPANADLAALIRNRIVGEMHLGHVRAGDQLPSVRDFARELDADHRAVGAALRLLEDEGLVEIRRRAGTFVAQQERLGGEMLSETAGWLADVLTEARRRRIGIPDFPDFVRSSTGRGRFRCACVESNTDSSTAVCMELEEEFGLESISLHPDDFPPQKGRAKPDPSALPAVLHDVRIVVTSGYHMHQVKPAAEALGKHFVMVSINSEMARIVERRLKEGPLTVIAVDPAFGDRLREAFRVRPDRIRMVMANDRAAIARLDRTEPVLATRAARRALPDLDLPLILPRFPSISLEASRELAEKIIRLNLESTGE
ncbi:MAG TPA: GntR family transcriptional regulator [Longimicrobium sp.]|nr:GntR family transcriptional regulator [Longimicrobium sp.]